MFKVSFQIKILTALNIFKYSISLSFICIYSVYFVCIIDDNENL
jgi:hypothetical protein